MGPAFEPVRVDMASRSLYPRGSEIGALTPSQTSVETAEGTWTFVGYDRTTAEASMDNADDEGNVHFSGAWKFTRKATPAQPGRRRSDGWRQSCRQGGRSELGRRAAPSDLRRV